MRWQRGRGAICAAEGSVNEHFHTARSLKKRMEERDSRGEEEEEEEEEEQEEGGIDRKQMEKNTAEIVNGKKK